MATPSPQPAPIRWQRRKEARPGEILDAALDVFVRQGFAATRIQDVAQQAGVTTGTVYLYYTGKEALFEAAVLTAMDRMITPWEERAAAHKGSAESLIVGIMREWWKTTHADPRYAAIPRLIAAEADRFPDLARHYVTAVLDRARALGVLMLERGIARGEFRQHDVGYAARLLMAPAQYAFAYNTSLARFDEHGTYDTGYLDAHLEIFLRGIRAASNELPNDATSRAPRMMTVRGRPPRR